MRAVWLHESGGPEKLVAGEAPDPEAAPRQALLDLEPGWTGRVREAVGGVEVACASGRR